MEPNQPPEETPAPPPVTPPAPPPTKIVVDMPRDLKAVYSNLVFLSHTPIEMVLDFAQMLPRTPRGTIVSRVVMSPAHAKMLQAALAQNIANYERQFGEIRLPQAISPLVDNFFRFNQEGEGGEK